MKRAWVEFVEKQNAALLADPSDGARHLLAIFDLVAGFEEGGLISYLMNSNADSFAALKECLSKLSPEEGVRWVQAVERKYGGLISPNRDARIEAISAMAGFEEGEDPFESAHRALQDLLPEIEAVAESAMSKLQASYGHHAA